MYPGSDKLAEKLAFKMAQEYGRILIRHNKEQREIRRLLRIHAASVEISQQSKPTGHTDGSGNPA